MRFIAVGRHLPSILATPLFGDRARHGKTPNRDDPSWKEWLVRGVDFYEANQRQSAGKAVNRSGYKVMRRVNLAGANVLEIGPGALDHIAFWQGRPAHFTCLDNNEKFLELPRQKLEEFGIPHTLKLMAPSDRYELPFGDASFDIVLSFFSLEHIYPLTPYLTEIARVLRPSGKFVGAIPCEGGVAWGLGRYLTSRRWLLKHTNIDPDRIICWEHPNFADSILEALANQFHLNQTWFWPLRIPLIDVNLVSSFICTPRARAASATI